MSAGGKRELVRRLLTMGTIRFDGPFRTKSGSVFDYETDLRAAYGTFADWILTSRLLLPLIPFDPGSFDYFLGVPETGTIIAYGLNLEKHRIFGANFPVNVLRAVPKPYQRETDSVHTVLPLSRSDRVCLVEDDVVSGETLLKYLDVAIGLGINIVGTVAVIDREVRDSAGLSVRDRVAGRGIPYQPVLRLADFMDCLTGEGTVS